MKGKMNPKAVTKAAKASGRGYFSGGMVGSSIAGTSGAPSGGSTKSRAAPAPQGAAPQGAAAASRSNKGGAMRGQARAAAMSGRTFADGGKAGKGKMVHNKQVSKGPGVGFPKSNTPAGKTGVGRKKG
jgi:hypothetical protein